VTKSREFKKVTVLTVKAWVRSKGRKITPNSGKIKTCRSTSGGKNSMWNLQLTN